MRKVSEVLVVIAMLVIIFFKIDPWKWFMPTDIQMLLLCLLVAGVCIWVGLIFRERARDERETLHLYRASRAGYLVGVLSLSILVVIQDLRHQLDPLVLVVLAIMIITKLVVLKVSQYRS
jgi:hypothetical protein